MNPIEPVLSNKREQGMIRWTLAEHGWLLTPAMDLFEDSEKVVVIIDIPGVSLEDVDINLDEKILNVTASMKESTVEGRYLLNEHPLATYKRTVHLNDHLNPVEAVAQLNDGVLKIVIPKAKKVIAKKIEVVSQ